MPNPSPEKTPAPTDPGRGTNPSRPRTPRPPIHTFLFWLLLLIILPVTLYMVRPGTRTDTDKIKQSEFERLLRNSQIKDAVVVTDTTAGRSMITGSYWPDPEAATAGDPGALRNYRVQIIYSKALEGMLRDHVDDVAIDTSQDWWGNLIWTFLPILLLIGVIYFMFSRQLRAAGRGAMQFGKSRARLMTPSQERVTFENVSGIDEAKEEVEEIIDFLRDPQKFQRLGGLIPKGVLLIGPPGTGKTLLARAIAGEAEVPFFSISGSDFVEMFVGVGASRVRDMFEEGKRHAPCIIFIDEIDAVGRSRFSGIGGGHDEREQTLNALLVEMDGFEPNTGIIVVAATNRPDVLDPALLRPGRFDRQITIDLPDLVGRMGILNVHSKRVPLAEDVNLEVVARGTPGFSGADLANLINEAALLAARLDKGQVQMCDLEEARDKVRWGKERRSRTIDEKDRQITAYHEAGHALVGLLSKHAMPLHKVTIVPRGNAYLGATMHLPEKDRYTQSRTELIDEICVLLGGRIAEELIFSDITSGAAMDIRQCTNLAKRMVQQWGMSKKMGPIHYSGREEHIYVGRDITRSEDHSEVTARELDLEVRSIIDGCEANARKLLTDNLDKLKLLGTTLLERETMAADEICTLLGLPLPIRPAPTVLPPTAISEIDAEDEAGSKLNPNSPV